MGMDKGAVALSPSAVSQSSSQDSAASSLDTILIFLLGVKKRPLNMPSMKFRLLQLDRAKCTVAFGAGLLPFVLVVGEKIPLGFFCHLRIKCGPGQSYNRSIPGVKLRTSLLQMIYCMTSEQPRGFYPYPGFDTKYVLIYSR